MVNNNQKTARIFKAFCDENRLQILELLKSGEKCACKLLETLQIGQSTLSHHMKILCDSEVVQSRREGKWTHYSLSEEGCQAAKDILDSILQQSEGKVDNVEFLHPDNGKKKLYVLTGFLGAGKTTVLLSILDMMKEKKIGIIQNEFGKLGIDGTILHRDGIEMTEISRGSIFCSCLKLSFVQALAEMSKQDLEYIFVESSGLADPSNIEEILAAVEQIVGDVYELKGVICLVDGVNFPEQINDVETVDRQLAHCHMALINKIDLIDECQLAGIMEAIRKINPVCDIVTCRNGSIGSDFLTKDLMTNQWAASEESLNREDNKPKTISLESGEMVTKDQLNAFLQAVLPSCYRIKGFFQLDEGWKQVDVVGELIDYKGCEPHDISQLVFLSKTGPQIIRTVDTEWKNIVRLPMKLKN